MNDIYFHSGFHQDCDRKGWHYLTALPAVKGGIDLIFTCETGANCYVECNRNHAILIPVHCPESGMELQKYRGN